MMKKILMVLGLLLVAGFVDAAGCGQLYEVCTTGVSQNLLLNSTGDYISLARPLSSLSGYTVISGGLNVTSNLTTQGNIYAPYIYDSGGYGSYIRMNSEDEVRIVPSGGGDYKLVYLQGSLGNGTRFIITSEGNSSREVWFETFTLGDARKGLTLRADVGEQQFIPYADNTYSLGTSAYEWKEVWAADTSINHDSLFMWDREGGNLYHIGINPHDGLVYETLKLSDLEAAGIVADMPLVDDVSGQITGYKTTLAEGVDFSSVRSWKALNSGKVESVSVKSLRDQVAVLEEENAILKDALLTKGVIREDELLASKNKLGV